ncbi:hepatic and glial cell adhesion molecule-like isoform X2 [Stegostoma tigrinum]|uniref:hepatic and glial cell adhesion molecule-like isoform X2 n=1 Tax=Stegostoma tigrinum TaxID=3053191 RepID=UPI00202B41AF|nr:hepatic and glial cell adhesion molecule-like isoform X2 [Stegostoma tigrinum]
MSCEIAACDETLLSDEKLLSDSGRRLVLAVSQQKTIHGTISESVLLPMKQNISHPNEVFSLEWRVIQNKTVRSILIFSPRSPIPYVSESFKNRVNFSHSKSELLLKNIQLSDEGIYELEVTTSDGKSTKYAVMLTVNVAVSIPRIEVFPEVPQMGDNVTLQCSVLEGNLVQYSWYRCEQSLYDGKNYRLSHNNRSLTLLNIQESEVGTYRCQARNHISVKHRDFVLQICTSTSVIARYVYIGYGGYPGYIGYILILVLCYQWIKELQKRPKDNDAIYENSKPVKQKLSVTRSAETKMCNMRMSNRWGR